MSNKIDKKLSNILGRAALEPGVNHHAMEMLRRYAMNFEVMHMNQFEVEFVEEVKRYCAAESYTRYKDLHTNMQTGRLKSSFSSEVLNALHSGPEWDNFDEKINSFISSGGETISLLWDEMNWTILKHLGENGFKPNR